MLQPFLTFFTSLGLMLALGPSFIAWAQRVFRSQVREYTPASHLKKTNTPTMGGLLIVACAAASMLLFGNGGTNFWLVLGCLGLFAIIGILDDWEKISKKRGVSKKVKFGLQVAGALVIVTLWYATGPDTLLYIPFTNFAPQLSWFIIPWGAFVMVAMSNGVNFTDGLDGLAAGTLVPVFITLGMIASYSQPSLGLACAAIAGALVGFVRFNWHPARIFMGDVGSLPLGATLALIALMLRHELLLVLAGGVFVLEAASVVIQIFYYHVLKRKFFRLAPIHHHFELGGTKEIVITKRFIALSFALCILSIILLALH